MKRDSSQFEARRKKRLSFAAPVFLEQEKKRALGSEEDAKKENKRPATAQALLNENDDAIEKLNRRKSKIFESVLNGKVIPFEKRREGKIRHEREEELQQCYYSLIICNLSNLRLYITLEHLCCKHNNEPQQEKILQPQEEPQAFIIISAFWKWTKGGADQQSTTGDVFQLHQTECCQCTTPCLPKVFSSFSFTQHLFHRVEEQKINQKNSWALNLIDHIDDVLATNLHSADTEGVANFQAASCTLDASVKIYSCRVDSMHNETYRMLGDLARGSTKKHGVSFPHSGQIGISL